jgi:hypothetical protein
MPIYTVTTLSKDESIDYHMSVLSSCGISMNNDDCELLWLYWMWFSPGTPASSTTKTGHHDIAEILLKVTLITINQSNQIKPLKSLE